MEGAYHDIGGIGRQIDKSIHIRPRGSTCGRVCGGGITEAELIHRQVDSVCARFNDSFKVLPEVVEAKAGPVAPTPLIYGDG